LLGVEPSFWGGRDPLWSVSEQERGIQGKRGRGKGEGRRGTFCTSMLMPSRSPLSFEGVPSASVVADTAETLDLRGGILRVEIGWCGLWVVGGVVVGGMQGGIMGD